ncbi:DNA ligase D [Aureimonas altamirensis]|uniref:DNA ligase D n=1 Tax=Aureimonas altamirensis TaxID=370622 RepID=UPI00203741B2|nr:DNA ligase D [Aureimonas altamirensis]MCM2505133.1 DNA ligase D [Aureimonas altamirensis]
MNDSLLSSYRKKRDFQRTSEPTGGSASSNGLLFVVQKHDATRLHYDFRLEWDGVLKSWAVTRGPSLDPVDKRLAVETEDHPMDYGDFEGTIPKGEYGGGTVMLWDSGTWEPVGDAAAGFADGHVKMQLHGQKMKGLWALVRMKPRPGEKRDNWLLIKEKDDEASTSRNIQRLDRSVKTGRTLHQIESGAAGRKPSARKRKEPALPAFRPVQLATLSKAPPKGDAWLHEVKYDGYRILIARGGNKVRLYTRNGKDWTDRFGALGPHIEALPAQSFLIDGEVVAFDGAGRTDFSALQEALTEGGALACFCFDLLEHDGEDLTGRPLTERKAALESLMAATHGSALHYSPHIVGHGQDVLAELCRKGLEGVVSKRADAPYAAGRSKAWLKSKCGRRQEFVIGGYSASDKPGRPFSSILVGVHEKQKFVYRGRVGSGFDGKALDALAGRFEALSRKDSPFETIPADIRRGAHYVDPVLVAEIDFAELTRDGHIRHGVFKGLRDDKPAGRVVEERPMEEVKPRSKGRKNADGKPGEIAGVRLTSPDRVVFEGQGITKRDLAEYYVAVADRMLVHAAGRPLSLVRCPQGGQKACFFQKHDTGGFPSQMGHVDIREKDGEEAVYLSLDGLGSVLAAVQMGTMEFHIWGAHNDEVDKPDRLVFDLDPDESLGFADVRQAALDLRDRLADGGLTSFPMLTGGKGIHLVLPLVRRQDWPTLKDFARGFAEAAVREEPDRFVATMSKARRKGRIFIDWLRNERGSTAIAPYSTRARKDAPVATPVGWDELGGLDSAAAFHLGDMARRIEEADPWADYTTVRQSITRRMVRTLA